MFVNGASFTESWKRHRLVFIAVGKKEVFSRRRNVLSDSMHGVTQGKYRAGKKLGFLEKVVGFWGF